MQSTLDRKVIYLMLRAARRQEIERRRKPKPERKPDALPARLTGDAWWLNAPEPAQAPQAEQAPRAIASPRLVAANDSGNFSEKVTADE
jgi:hypothetical protein